MRPVKESQPRMADIQAAPEELAATTGASQFLTVNIVMPAVGESAKEGAGFARFDLRPHRPGSGTIRRRPGES